MSKTLLTLFVCALLCACKANATDPLDGTNDAKNSQWNLQFTAPIYMTGWVEASEVEDITGRVINHGAGGTVGGSYDFGVDSELARGWPDTLGGSIRAVSGADLPARIFVRWQSIVEQKTYRAWVDLPDQARELMHKSTHRRCPDEPDSEANSMAMVFVGLAPGGTVQAWVLDECYQPVKVARAQAELEPLGPSQGATSGRYAYKLGKNTKRYIEKYGIPYGSW